MRQRGGKPPRRRANMEITKIFGRMNTYRDRAFAEEIAKRTGGELLADEFEDEFGKYWVVIWRTV